jgi:hypothetical protein
MNQAKMVFAQLMSFASDDVFKRCVDKYNGNYKVKDLSCWKQFLCMSFGQLTHRESLSDTILCLRLHSSKLYHLGIGQAFSKSTVSRANNTRDWRIYSDFALKLIEQAKELYQDDNQLDIKLKGRIFALDSTVVDLCLSVFWWAKFRTTKAAVKINTLLDLKTSLPEFILISDGAVHDVKTLDSIHIPSGSYLVMDKAYIDFRRLWKLNQDNITFIIRAKDNMDYKVIGRRVVNKSTGLICDQTIILQGIKSSQNYPGPLRRIRYYDKETGNMLIFITNNFKLSALNIAKMYRFRWGIETFFKWIKQHLKILSFWGHTENAVKTQIWVAISTYVIVAIAKKKLNLKFSLYEILQMISLSVFDKNPIHQLFNEENYQDVKEPLYKQLKMF